MWLAMEFQNEWNVLGTCSLECGINQSISGNEHETFSKILQVDLSKNRLPRYYHYILVLLFIISFPLKTMGVSYLFWSSIFPGFILPGEVLLGQAGAELSELKALPPPHTNTDLTTGFLSQASDLSIKHHQISGVFLWFSMTEYCLMIITNDVLWWSVHHPYFLTE